MRETTAVANRLVVASWCPAYRYITTRIRITKLIELLSLDKVDLLILFSNDTAEAHSQHSVEVFWLQLIYRYIQIRFSQL